jgi:mono/diheme cytochrome c family protein
MQPSLPWRVLAGPASIAGLIATVVVTWICIQFFYLGRSREGDAARTPQEANEQAALAKGKELYGNYCAACHGDKGDGNGPAAKYLYPKPRNFGEAQFRVVSTLNNMPTDQDLLHVITRGMPGSAMFPFAHLSEADRQALVANVRQLSKAGFLERVRAEAGEDGDLAELERSVDGVLHPGPALEVPADLPPPSPESIARGADLFQKGCASCHGQTGKGDGVQDQRDRSGMPIRPRDFTRGIFKGGRDAGQLYARIRIGMPGTPMPASPDLKPAEVGDLINFVLSLSDASSQTKVEHKRTQVVAKRSHRELPLDISQEDWGLSQPARIVVSPLWWRNYADPSLEVQALHDGNSLAVRLSWQDATRNDLAVRPQDFEDMAAIQLFKGIPEPFLGMGMADRSVDVWLWRAGWHGNAVAHADVDTVYPNMAVDLYPFEQPGGGPRPHATERQPREFITAWAAGNLRSDPTQPFPGNSLQARGFGSLTMQPRVSQLVSASAQWQNGRWTVVLRRPLGISPEAGISLSPGDNLSIAFAIWDGAAGDRNGQKLVSIWHDLHLE